MPVLDRNLVRLKVVEAIQQCGWNVLFLSNWRQNPYFKLSIYRGEQSYLLKVYSWNATQGGRTRSEDEYRIQVKINRNVPILNKFEPESGHKLLILGWWDEVGVFAAFDYNKHPSPMGWSSSIQIPKDTLFQAYQNGFAAHVKDNEEIAVGFRPDFFTTYVENMEAIHTFGEVTQDFEVLEEVSDAVVVVNQQILERVTEPRRRTVQTVNRRVRQSSFDNRVLTAYQFRCAFCNLQLKLVDAAHIIPVAQEISTDETCNGIALCSLHHRAYDVALITFDQQYEVKHNSDKMRQLREIGRDGEMARFLRDLRPIIHLPPAITDRPHSDYVRQANRLRGWTL